MTAIFDWMVAMAPPWLSSERAQEPRRWLDALAAAVTAAREAVPKVRRMWLVATCPDEVLDLHGVDRRLPRWPNEPHASYRARLLDAVALHQLGGTAAGIQRGLAALGFSAEVVELFRSGVDAVLGDGRALGDGTRFGRNQNAFLFDVVLALAGGLSSDALALALAEIEERKRAAAQLRALVADTSAANWADADAAPPPLDGSCSVVTGHFAVLGGGVFGDGSLFGPYEETTQWLS